MTSAAAPAGARPPDRPETDARPQGIATVADPIACVLAGDDPAAALAEDVVSHLAGLDPRATAETIARLRSRWPRAGIWRDLRAALQDRRRRSPQDEGDDRPAIRADGELHAVVAEAEAALAIADADVFVRGGGVGLSRGLKHSGPQRCNPLRPLVGATGFEPATS